MNTGKNIKNRFNVIGLMSGTSLDGLDIAHAEFQRRDKQWSFKLHRASTLPYSAKWAAALAGAHKLAAEDLLELHAAYGRFLGKACVDFIGKYKVKRIDFIASHGHTVYHQPDRKFTFQLGDGNSIHAATGIPVICDFRSLDVTLGGEGAPLVPVGDRFLFTEYDICLNLGGIANMSREEKNRRVAFDICFCNMSLNYLMNIVGKSYDDKGRKAASGQVNTAMLAGLKRVYRSLERKRPSLGRELFEKEIRPMLDDPNVPLEDKLATCVESTAIEIAQAVTGKKHQSMLCTGGGAYNAFLISRILDNVGDDTSIVIPDDNMIKYKEALIFAFLGVLRLNVANNSLKSVTGAERDSSGGVMVGFK